MMLQGLKMRYVIDDFTPTIHQSSRDEECFAAGFTPSLCKHVGNHASSKHQQERSWASS